MEETTMATGKYMLAALLAASSVPAVGAVTVIGNSSAEFSAAVQRCRPDQVVIDLVRIPLDFSQVQAQYDGISW